MILGPKGFDKIAVLGSSPSSTMLAPFDRPDWAIWCTSPSVFSSVAVKRSDVWFELHRWLPSSPGKSGAAGTRQWFSPEFRQFLREYKGTVLMTEMQPDIPGCVVFPYKELIAKYGPYHFTSSVAWMLAYAIDQKPKMLGLFGIDMSAGSEWAYQRPGCQHFVGLAKAAGIDIVLPPESDLMRHSTLYGIGEHNQRFIKLRERQCELENNKQVFVSQMQSITANMHHTQGALDMVNYMIELWSDDLEEDYSDAFSFSGCFVQDSPPSTEHEQEAIAEQTPKSVSKGNGANEAGYVAKPESRQKRRVSLTGTRPDA